MLYYNKQSISDIDIRYVSRALKKNILTRGQLNVEFEKNICEKTKSNYSVSFNSASSALTAACFALGLKKDDLVWTVPNTFVSTASCALHFSAKIDFVDIDNKYKIMCVDKLEEKLIRSEKIKKLPKILIPVHYAGQATNQEKIFKLSKKYGFKVLEDASHSFGGMRDSEPVGSCKWSDIVVSSFHPVKTITTGEGGVACTNSKELDFRLKIYRNNGIIRDYRFLKKKTKEIFYYEQQYLGHNFHLPDINAALGISQLKRLKKFINKRKKIFNYYNKNINNKNLILPSIDKKNNSTHHLYVCNLKDGIDRKKVLSYFYKNKITLNVLYIPVHLHPIYYKKGFRKGDYPNSEWHYNTSVALPIYYDLSKKNLDKIVNLLNKIKI